MPCHLEATRKFSPKAPGKHTLLLFPSSFWSEICGIMRRSRQPCSLPKEHGESSRLDVPLCDPRGRAAHASRERAELHTHPVQPPATGLVAFGHQMQTCKWAWHLPSHDSQWTANQLTKTTEHSALCKGGSPSRQLNCSP